MFTSLQGKSGGLGTNIDQLKSEKKMRVFFSICRIKDKSLTLQKIDLKIVHKLQKNITIHKSQGSRIFRRWTFHRGTVCHKKKKYRT